jgi:hypothetical protein
VLHAALHVPFAQDRPDGQTLPHDPQFAGSLAMFAQLLPQRI